MQVCGRVIVHLLWAGHVFGCELPGELKLKGNGNLAMREKNASVSMEGKPFLSA